MGSVINFDGICHHCENNSLFSGYYYKTGEHFCSCNACGINQSAFFKRNIDGVIVSRDIAYPLDGSIIMAVRAYRPWKEQCNGDISYDSYDDLPEEDTILWEMPITSDMMHKDIEDFMFPKTKRVYRSNEDMIGTKVLTEPNPAYEDALAAKYSFRNLFHKADNEYKQLWYKGNGFRFETGDDGKVCFVLEEALAIWDRHVSDGMDIAKSYLTVWDGSQNELDYLKGMIPDANYLIKEEV